MCNNSNIANYADDTSPYACERDVYAVLEKLDSDSKELTTWFRNNGLKANPEKFHLILSNPNDKLLIKCKTMNCITAIIKNY